jgi:uncharacterized protein YciI
MKSMKQKVLSVFGMILFLFVRAAAEVKTAKENPVYDAGLAKELGGDEMGMKHYVLVLLKTGPNDSSIKGKEREDLFAGHMANITRLADEKKLAVAGPFGKNEWSYRGLFILNVPTVEEARSLTQTDPAVKAGIFLVDLIPWYSSASLMATYDIHKRITKSGP